MGTASDLDNTYDYATYDALPIDHPEKIGMGSWDIDSTGTALDDLDQLGFGWYYDWGAKGLQDVDATPDTAFVPMVWDGGDVTARKLGIITASDSPYLLGFNEPNSAAQANMTPQQAIALWPQLETTGKLLGSPAPTINGVLGEDSWLGQFMQLADQQNLRVDFIAVHYYSADPSVDAMKDWLTQVHEQYGKPIWVTEWALVDWADQSHFSLDETAAFAKAATAMMDDLDFVQRQSWFAPYDGGDGWHINTELFDDQGNLTVVGQVFQDAIAEGKINEAANQIVGTAGNDTFDGTNGNDHITGVDGNDVLHGNAGGDTIEGGVGYDKLYGDADNDSIDGGAGNDLIVGGDGSDTLTGGDGNDTIHTDAGDGIIQGGSGLDNVAVDGTAGVTLDLGAAGIESAKGGAGDDVFSASQQADGRSYFYVDGGAGNDSISGFTGTDQLYGGTGNDTLNGGGGRDLLDGGDGDDQIHGGDGDDARLYGGAGNDSIDGGAGNDILYGGAGSDTFVGGAGNNWLVSDQDGVKDVFVFDAASGTDRIFNFELGTDQIDVTAFHLHGMDDVSVSYSDTSTIISIDDSTTRIALVNEHVTADDLAGSLHFI